MKMCTLMILLITIIALVTSFQLQPHGLHHRLHRPIKSSLSLSKGFGSGSKVASGNKVDSSTAETVDLNTNYMDTIQSITAQPCPCESGLTYGECCHPAHYPPENELSMMENADLTPEKVVRARYSANFLQHTNFLISSAHSTEPSCSKHLTESRDKERGLKKWTKEILSSPVTLEHLEFLRIDHPEDFTLLQSDNKASLFPSKALKQHVVRFRVYYRYNIAEVAKGNDRKKSKSLPLTEKLVGIEEVSAIVFAEDNDHYLHSLQQRKVVVPRWYYTGGVTFLLAPEIIAAYSAS